MKIVQFIFRKLVLSIKNIVSLFFKYINYTLFFAVAFLIGQTSIFIFYYFLNFELVNFKRSFSFDPILPLNLIITIIFGLYISKIITRQNLNKRSQLDSIQDTVDKVLMELISILKKLNFKDYQSEGVQMQLAIDFKIIRQSIHSINEILKEKNIKIELNEVSDKVKETWEFYTNDKETLPNEELFNIHRTSHISNLEKIRFRIMLDINK